MTITLLFMSIGNSEQVEDDKSRIYTMIHQILPGTKIIRVVDRDDKSDREVSDCESRGTKVLKRRPDKKLGKLWPAV